MAKRIGNVAVERAAPEPRPLSEQQRRGRHFLAVYVALVSLATVIFVALAVLVRTEDVIANFDAPIAIAIQSIQLPVVSWVLVHMSDLGFSPYDVICVIVIGGTLFALRLRLEAVVVIASTLIAGELGTLAKDLVQRARPTSNFVHIAAHLADFSFPSGHVIFATVLFGTTMWVVWVTWESSPVRNLALAFLAVPILLMGPSRVYLGEHWPTDVLGAYCLGAIWVAVTIEALLVFKPRAGKWWQGRSNRPSWAGF